MSSPMYLNVPLSEVRAAIRDRVVGAAEHEAVVWSREGAELVVYPHSLGLRATGGFLVAELQVEAAETGPCVARLVFFLGTAAAGAGLAAAVSHDAATPALLVDAWGEALRLAVWEGLLDVVEGVVVVASQAAGVPLRVLGFTGAEDGVQIAVGA